MSGPYPFHRGDLSYTRLLRGARSTLRHFRQWRDANPERIAEHLHRYPGHVRTVTRENAPSSATARQARLEREITYFGLYNLAEVPTPALVTQLADQLTPDLLDVPAAAGRVMGERGSEAAVELLRNRFPVLKKVPETDWLAQRLHHLHRCLPDRVIHTSGLGKVVRALTGVLAIATYDTVGLDRNQQVAQLRRIVPGAYTLGAAYAIVDDVFHDAPVGEISAQDRQHCHRLVLHGLRGRHLDRTDVPDHPLAEELHDLHRILLDRYPYTEFRHLYRAAHAMYLAQDRDAAQSATDEPGERYPDMLVKAAMSRTVANVLARRRLSDGFYRRCINTILLSQLRDDLKDRHDDALHQRTTPFTMPWRSGRDNPLHDLFAYEAYIVWEIYGGEPLVAEHLSYFGAKTLIGHFAADPQESERLLADYDATPEIAAFVRCAVTELADQDPRNHRPLDKDLVHHVTHRSRIRSRTKVEVRTFIADRLPFINSALDAHRPATHGDELDQAINYALDAPGKRLRPALTLMLADGLGVEYERITPLLAAGEMFHTASLLFDDLPAQDDATMRRGRPAAHTVFAESTVQLAGIALLSHGFSLVSDLADRFNPATVTSVVALLGTALGSERLCRGQHLDLHLSERGTTDQSAILHMYRLKTSAGIEATLVPLMRLMDRDESEVTAVTRFADSAGIVFQIRDDLLDASASADELGKPVAMDTGKVNLVRVCGPERAREIMREHVALAQSWCAQLPFNTELLRACVEYLAYRRR